MLALAAADGAAACSHLAAGVRAQALAVTSSSENGTGKGCAHVLGSMFAREAPQTRAAQRHTTVTAVRVDGDRAFALFRQPGMPAGFFPMQR
jgi:hypothetical protein